MKYTPIAAFGYVTIMVEMNANEERDVEIDTNGLASSGHYFYVKGRVASIVPSTGETLEDRTSGWLNVEHQDAKVVTRGKVKNKFTEDSAWLCISHQYNPKGLPNLRSLVLKDGESITLPNGTNLLLGRGTLKTPSKTFEGPSQIRIRSGDILAISLGTSYSLYFDKNENTRMAT
jgi:hypothetical protein